jgi:SAM-dependent methyltransferase
MVITRQQRVKSGWSPIGRTHTTQDYYQVRDCGQVSYDGYWGQITDPDGNVRQRVSEAERLNYLENVAEELAFVRNLPPGRIVDFGCGPGWFLRELQPAWDVLGIEICHHACTLLEFADIPHEINLERVEPAAVDVVFCHHVIEHMPDPISLIGDLRAILKPGGWLILGTPDFASPCAVHFGENYRLLHDQTHCSLFTLESLHRFLRDHGFVVHDVRFPFPLRYATPENFARWHDTSQVSPAWPGNWMTFYCTR